MPQRSQLRPGEIVVDLFAGGGGASTGLEQALGRPVDIAVNHNPWAVSMHAANHPLTTHLCQDVWEADPRIECGGKPVGWLHASPDCTHFSQAKGGQPRSRATRSLSWVVLRWAGTVRPRIISLENVKEILKWGPLVAKRDRATSRVVKLDGSVAAPGERVAIDQQFLIPDKRHAGRTWRHFVGALHRLGYAVEWRRLKACDYGAGTSRERLFLVARCDGQPIQWPAPTHGPGAACPHVPAADCIDWRIPSPSIFDRKRPLADATLRRIARGLKRYVLDAAEPFIVGDAAPVITEHANSSNARSWRADEPLRTQCAGVKGGHFALAAATLVQTGYGERDGQEPRSLDIGQPLGTVVAGGVKHALATASLVKFRGNSDGAAITDPLPTITSGAGAARPAGAPHALGVVTAFLEQAYGGGPNGNPAPARAATDPLSTITTSAAQQRLVTGELATLSPEHEAGALRVAAFLIKYYGTGQAIDPREPLDTITTRDRLALVTVHVRGVPHVIVDIGLRMLKPHELYAAQGFPPDYIIDRTADGRAISVSRSVAMVGNSVSPPPLRALAEANLDAEAEPLKAAA
ncbi:DNA cytosine methyltransferase [Thermomonas mangrovi]|uniref:DNA cytosine methyltransferase n=1 Tax=Thermomonas mangrovi TaxID=2993316 RepID=UPI0031F33711